MIDESLFTLAEIAAKLKVSKDTARRMFARQPGVLAVNGAGKRSTVNGRVLIRVPQSVFERVWNSMEKI